MKRPWKNRVVVKLFLSYLAVVLLLFVLFYLYAAFVVRDFHISSLSGKMRDEAAIVSRLLALDSAGAVFDQICRELARDLGVRITVIALDGKVLGDSDESSAAMENHGSRPEVVEALAKGAGSSTRYSTTVHHEMLYQATLDREKKRIIRLSVPLNAVEAAEGSIRHAILAGLLVFSALGLLLAFFFSRLLERRVKSMVEFSASVAQGSFPQSIHIDREDELSLLERNLNEMSRAIQEKIKGVVGEKEKVDSILRCMSEGVLVVDNQGRLILLNQNAQKMFGLPATQTFQGASFMEVSRHPEMKKLLEEVLACDCSTDCFAKEVCLDHGQWFRVSAVSLRDADQKALGYILVFHDITELKRLETVRSDFVANVSHELRTPLTAIRGYAETLLRSPPADPKEAENFLTIIYRHSERLGRLIDDLLALSDLESGKIQITRERLQPAELIARVLEIFGDQARKKDISLSKDISPGLPAILGDSDRLQQLLINLIDNAVKYTPAGGEVEVSAALAAGANHHLPVVEIAVSDTGGGIPEKDLPRLTERFYRVDKARSRELGGTGLGLAIVKHIVQAHQGQLKIESRIGKGTTVRVFLPVEDAEAKLPLDSWMGKTA
ncbi:MAG TPA: ATP-binding protein [Candidatus Binatia bacterium]|jgi:two-component system phosphate regulon sensor histidine kinase PhoR